VKEVFDKYNLAFLHWICVILYKVLPNGQKKLTSKEPIKEVGSAKRDEEKLNFISKPPSVYKHNGSVVIVSSTPIVKDNSVAA